jgi:diaminopimelate epimerase
MTEFFKMHGLGNDFVVFDARRHSGSFSPQLAVSVADRRSGIGCDQIMVLRPPASGGDVFLEMINADGSTAGACGNGTRCVADLLMAESGRQQIGIETVSGLLTAWRAGDQISVDMGPPGLGWQDIPLSREMDTGGVQLAAAPVPAICVSMGNPHAVLFVADAEAVNIAELGPLLEQDPLFPERANIEFAHIIAADRIRMRVWERGAGITRACGSGACATAVAAVRAGLAGRQTELVLDGGVLGLQWTQDDRVIMTGPSELVSRGHLEGGLAAHYAAEGPG